jgi:hypothetical protein
VSLDDAFGPVKTARPLNPDDCEACEGRGEFVYGDGGGGPDEPTDTGITEICAACNGSGLKPDPLIEEAQKALARDE